MVQISGNVINGSGLLSRTLNIQPGGGFLRADADQFFKGRIRVFGENKYTVGIKKASITLRANSYPSRLIEDFFMTDLKELPLKFIFYTDLVEDDLSELRNHLESCFACNIEIFSAGSEDEYHRAIGFFKNLPKSESAQNNWSVEKGRILISANSAENMVHILRELLESYL